MVIFNNILKKHISTTEINFHVDENLPNKNKFIILITRLLIDCVIMLYYLFSLKLLNEANTSAHIAFYASFKRFAAKEVKVIKNQII